MTKMPYDLTEMKKITLIKGEKGCNERKRLVQI